MNAIHKAQLSRLLIEIIDNPVLSQNLYFKGGTCAAMAGFLDRFSVDLDFDIKSQANISELRTELFNIFKHLDFRIENSNEKTLFYILKYESPKGQRNTL